MNRLAAPGGGHEQLRSLVDVDCRSVGEAQHRVRARARADRAPSRRWRRPLRARLRTARYRPPLAETTVARGPPGAIQASRVSRPRYRTDRTSAAAAASIPQRRQREDDRCGMAITRRSPFISASAVRHAAQRLTWSSSSTRLPPVRVPLRYARKSCRNSAQPATACWSACSRRGRARLRASPRQRPPAVISCSALRVDLLTSRTPRSRARRSRR